MCEKGRFAADAPLLLTPSIPSPPTQPFLALAYVYNKRLGYLLPALLWTAATAYAYVLGYVYNASEFALPSGPQGKGWLPRILAPCRTESLSQTQLHASQHPNPTLHTDITEGTRYQRDYYFRAWTRAPVYLLGVAFAFLWLDFTEACQKGTDHWFPNMFLSNQRKRLTAPIAALFGAAFLLLGLCAYGAQPAYHNGGLPKFWDVAYLALSRSAWCVGLLLLCFLLFQGYGGPIRALLENRAMAVLSRLTFAAYLLHPARKCMRAMLMAGRGGGMVDGSSAHAC